MKKTFKILAVGLTVLSAAILGTVGYYNYVFADSYCISAGSELDFGISVVSCETTNEEATPVQSSGVERVSGYKTKISLFGIIPIKQVEVTVAETDEVLILGTPFGIKMYTEGVLVIGYSDVDTASGNKNPAIDSGIMIGDTVLSIDGVEVSNNLQVQEIISLSDGKMLELRIKRGDSTFNVEVKPVLSRTENRYKAGLWIRDSSAGIGTMTFYCPSTDVAAGLGHGICDSDTGDIIPLKDGEFLNAEIVGIKKSTEKEAGEVQGVFSSGKIADFSVNDITGVYGTDCNCNLFKGYKTVEIAMKQEINTGKATVLTSVDNGVAKEYECVVEKIYSHDDSKIKNFIIKITDKKLLEKTGGIVQGMSGSPILQNGKLIGAVTHVLVEDSTKGYGIFAENMLETAQSVAENNKLKDAS